MPEAGEPRDGRFDWSEVAAAWDEHGDHVERTGAPMTARLLADLDPRPGQTIVELGAGTGELGLRIAASVQPGGSVIVSDVAQGMVDLAAARVAFSGAEGVEVRRLDAQEIDLPDGFADAIACRMGYMFVPDPAAAFRDARRVLKGGGRLVFAVWGSPDANPWALTLGMAAMQAGLETGADPFAPGGMFSLADADKVRGLLEEAGFGHVSVEAVDVIHEFPDFESYWSTTSRLAGPIAAALACAPRETVEAVRETARGFSEPYSTPDGLRMPGRALCARAT